jgi:hypothetical protein
MFKRLFCLAAIVLSTATGSMAQFEAGSLTGIVKDPTGAVVAGATVELSNQSTNVVRTTKTSDGGEYDFVAVQPGKYSVTARQAGFKGQAQSFQLVVGQRLAVDLGLLLPTATEVVAVTSESTTTVETASSELGSIEGSKAIQDLPLDSRNFTQLIALAAGANMHVHSNNSQSLGYTNGRGTNGAGISGNPGEATIYLFDGIQSVNNDIAAVIFFPSVDAIEEFKVQTSGAPAAYGGGPSIVNLTIRSGTNDFHGTFYEFNRESSFDAKNYFDPHAGPTPPFHLNQFGANVGGPVWIPHILNGRNKLFFFGDWDGRRQAQALTYVNTVPTSAFLTGDLSALCTSNGGTFSGSGICSVAKYQLYNPISNTPFANNFISPTLWNSSSTLLATLFQKYAVPNTGSSSAVVSNFTYNGATVNNIDQGDIRVDYHTDKTTIFGRFSKEDPFTINPGSMPAPALGGTTNQSRPGSVPIPGEQIVLGYSRPLGNNKFYEARLAWSRLNEMIVIANNALTIISTQYGIPGANSAGIPGLTNFAISGQVGLGDGDGNLLKTDNNWEVDQAFTLIHGRHEYKAGFDYLHRRQANYDPIYPAGNFTFSGAYTGYGFTDFLLGHPISSELDSAEFLQLRRTLPSFYVQDTWRIRPNLVLEYGIRNDMVTPWNIKHNYLAGFDPTATNPDPSVVPGQTQPAGYLIPVGTGTFSGSSVVDGRYTNWGPRLGFSYSLNAKTVIRGGGGIYYANENQSGNPFQANAPFHGSYITTNSSAALGSAANGTDWAASKPISTGFPTSRPTSFPIAGTSVQWYLRSYKNMTSNEYSLNVQRQFSSRDMLSVAYVGQTSTHVLIAPNVNLPIPGPTPTGGSVNWNRPRPDFAGITQTCQCGNGKFNSLQASYRVRIPNSLDLLASYTYSHSIDDTSGTGNSTAPQDPFNWWLSYKGNSDWDLRHGFVASWNYDLPIGKGKLLGKGANPILDMLIGGWELNSIDTFQTGNPFTPTMATSTLNTGGSVQYPNRIGTGKISKPTVSEWFNPADFAPPGNYTYGNSKKNILFGPGTKEVDASLFKNIKLGADGTRRLQLHLETFNVFNTPQFNNPISTIGSSTAGTITSAGTPVLFERTSRELQLAAKLYW